MKRWQFASLLLALLIVLLAILAAVPATSHLVRGVMKILSWIWMVIAGILVLLTVISFGGLLGFLVKAFPIAWLDSKLEARKQITRGMQWGIAILGGLIVGVLFAILIPTLMSWETWMRWVSMEMGWSGVYETLPTWAGIYAWGTFVWLYMVSPYMLSLDDDDR